MLRKAEIRVEGIGTFAAQAGPLLLDVLNARGVDLHNDCGGQGKCGRCRVEFLSDPPEPLAGDRRHLSEGEIAGGVRLACFHQLRGDCSLRVPEPADRELLDDL